MEASAVIGPKKVIKTANDIIPKCAGHTGINVIIEWKGVRGMNDIVFTECIVMKDVICIVQDTTIIAGLYNFLLLIYPRKNQWWNVQASCHQGAFFCHPIPIATCLFGRRVWTNIQYLASSISLRRASFSIQSPISNIQLRPASSTSPIPAILLTPV